MAMVMGMSILMIIATATTTVLTCPIQGRRTLILMGKAMHVTHARWLLEINVIQTGRAADNRHRNSAGMERWIPIKGVTMGIKINLTDAMMSAVLNQDL